MYCIARIIALQVLFPTVSKLVCHDFSSTSTLLMGAAFNFFFAKLKVENIIGKDQKYYQI